MPRYTEQQSISRFWSHVSVVDGSCWEWTGPKQSFGYGVSYYANRNILAHRRSWMIRHGDIPPGLCVLHKCDNPACVNPDHLFLGSRIENNEDCNSKGRRSVGEKHVTSKITEMVAIEIKSCIHPPSHYVKEYGITRACVSSIRRNKTWKHLQTIV